MYGPFLHRSYIALFHLGWPSGEGSALPTVGQMTLQLEAFSAPLVYTPTVQPWMDHCRKELMQHKSSKWRPFSESFWHQLEIQKDNEIWDKWKKFTFKRFSSIVVGLEETSSKLYLSAWGWTISSFCLPSKWGCYGAVVKYITKHKLKYGFRLTKCMGT